MSKFKICVRHADNTFSDATVYAMKHIWPVANAIIVDPLNSAVMVSVHHESGASGHLFMGSAEQCERYFNREE